MITGKKRKSSKYVFTLKNVNTEKVDQKYGITLISNISNFDNQPQNTTKLTELTDTFINKPAQVISFLDESKKLYQCNISMIDFETGNDIETLRYNCYWCRNKFNSRPIGCPINYVSSKIIKKYHSEVSKDKYTITENITKNKREFFNKNKFIFKLIKDKNINTSISMNNIEHFETDGVFCSFNCCMAFIKDNKKNKLYEKSESLLLKMYIDLTGLKNVNINPAPHWRLLQEYGGNLSITQFRENFNKTSYEYHGVIKNSSLYKPVASLFEEKINF